MIIPNRDKEREYIMNKMKNKNKTECGKKEYIKVGKGGTWAVCGCPNGWLCSDCSSKPSNKSEVEK